MYSSWVRIHFPAYKAVVTTSSWFFILKPNVKLSVIWETGTNERRNLVKNERGREPHRFQNQNQYSYNRLLLACFLRRSFCPLLTCPSKKQWDFILFIRVSWIFFMEGRLSSLVFDTEHSSHKITIWALSLFLSLTSNVALRCFFPNFSLVCQRHFILSPHKTWQQLNEQLRTCIAKVLGWGISIYRKVLEPTTTSLTARFDGKSFYHEI